MVLVVMKAAVVEQLKQFAHAGRPENPLMDFQIDIPHASDI